MHAHSSSSLDRAGRRAMLRSTTSGSWVISQPDSFIHLQPCAVTTPPATLSIRSNTMMPFENPGLHAHLADDNVSVILPKAIHSDQISNLDPCCISPSTSSTQQSDRHSILLPDHSTFISVRQGRSLCKDPQSMNSDDSLQHTISPIDEVQGMAQSLSNTLISTDSSLSFANSDQDLAASASGSISTPNDRPTQATVDFLAKLPFELALCILYHLPSHNDALQAASVSRKWRTIATDNAVWRELFFRHTGWAIRQDAHLVLAKQVQDRKQAAEQLKRQEAEMKQKELETMTAKRASILKSWRESLHIPSLPDLATLSLGRLSESSRPTTSATAQGLVESPPSPVRPTNSMRFGFFNNPARGASTPEGKKRAQLASHSSSSAAEAETTNQVEIQEISTSVSNDDQGIDRQVENFVATLNWPKLYSDRFVLEQRWRRCRKPGDLDQPPASKSRLSSATFEPSKRYLRGHKDSVYCVRHDDGIGSGTSGKIVSGSRDRTIRVWDADSGECRHLIRGHSASVLSLQYDDQILVSGSSDNMVLVWDFGLILSTTVQDPDEMDGVEDQLEDPNPDLNAAPVSNDRASNVLVHGKKNVLSILRGHTSAVLDVAFDENWIISCSKDSTVRVWKRSDFSLFRKYSNHRGPVNAAGLENGKVVSASGDGSMQLWDVASGETLRTFSGHERGLACIAFSGTMVVSGSNDKTIRTWNATNGKCNRVFQGHDPVVRAVSYDSQRQMIVSGGYDRSIRLWDADVPDQGPLREIKVHTARIFDVEFNTTRIVSASEDQRICISFFGGKGIDTSLFV